MEGLRRGPEGSERVMPRTLSGAETHERAILDADLIMIRQDEVWTRGFYAARAAHATAPCSRARAAPAAAA